MIKPILMDFPMPIITERLIIRPPRMGEGKSKYDAVLESYDQLKSTMSWAKTKPTVEDSETLVRQGAANWILKNNAEPYLPLHIFDRKKEIFLGVTGYYDMDWEVPSIKLGYWLRTSHQKQGIMTEAVNAITRYAFMELKMKRVEIQCDILNKNSQKVPERLGYQREAILKNSRINPASNQISDTVIYARYDMSALVDLVVHW